MNSYSMAAAEKAEATQRALEVRQRLLSHAIEPEEGYRVNEREARAERHRRQSSRGWEAARNEDDPAEEPISMWA